MEKLNTIIRKKGTGKEKEKELLDELITQMQLEMDQPVEESPPIEITDQVKNKMIQLMDAFLSNKEKLNKVSEIRKELTSQSVTHLKELETLMKLYGLTELIKGANKFVLEKTTRKKPLKKADFKQVMTYVLGDAEKVDKIYQTASAVSEEVVVEKIKCVKYKT